MRLIKDHLDTVQMPVTPAIQWVGHPELVYQKKPDEEGWLIEWGISTLENKIAVREATWLDG